MEAKVEDVTVLRLHHDVRATTAEQVVRFTFSESPWIRETRNK
jgi:hypothetical protein